MGRYMFMGHETWCGRFLAKAVFSGLPFWDGKNSIFGSPIQIWALVSLVSFGCVGVFWQKRFSRSCLFGVVKISFFGCPIQIWTFPGLRGHRGDLRVCW